MTKFICPGQAGPVFRHDHYLSTSHNEQWWQVQFSLYSRESGMLLMYLLLLTTICLEISGRCGRQLMTVTIGRRVLAVALAQALAHRWLLDYWLNCTPNRQQIDIWVHYTDHNYNYFFFFFFFQYGTDSMLSNIVPIYSIQHHFLFVDTYPLWETLTAGL